MQKSKESEQQMTGILARNIQTLLDKRKQAELGKTREARIADSITRFAGSMTFVYVHLAWIGAWIVWNLGVIGLKPFDPSFVVLAMVASVEAIFLSTFVLISQNRMNEQADKRAELNLQVSLLAEHEVTRLITLTSAIAKKLDVEAGSEEELEELGKDVHPEKVLDTIEAITGEK